MDQATAKTAALNIVTALGSAIKELRSVPSGELYAQVMGKLSLETYYAAINVLVKTKLVKSEGHLLTWIG